MTTQPTQPSQGGPSQGGPSQGGTSQGGTSQPNKGWITATVTDQIIVRLSVYEALALIRAIFHNNSDTIRNLGHTALRDLALQANQAYYSVASHTVKEDFQVTLVPREAADIRAALLAYTSQGTVRIGSCFVSLFKMADHLDEALGLMYAGFP